MAKRTTSLSVNTTESTFSIDEAGAVIRNTSSNTVFVDFDNTVFTSSSFPIKTDESLTADWSFSTLHYKTSSGNATLKIIKISP